MTIKVLEGTIEVHSAVRVVLEAPLIQHGQGAAHPAVLRRPPAHCTSTSSWRCSTSTSIRASWPPGYPGDPGAARSAVPARHSRACSREEPRGIGGEPWQTSCTRGPTAAFAASMAEAMEKAMDDLLFADKGIHLPAADTEERKDRRRLFIAIAARRDQPPGRPRRRDRGDRPPRNERRDVGSVVQSRPRRRRRRERRDGRLPRLPAPPRRSRPDRDDRRGRAHPRHDHAGPLHGPGRARQPARLRLRPEVARVPPEQRRRSPRPPRSSSRGRCSGGCRTRSRSRRSRSSAEDPGSKSPSPTPSGSPASGGSTCSPGAPEAMTIAEADVVACKRDAEQRRAVLLARPDLNGIDRVEVDAVRPPDPERLLHPAGASGERRKPGRHRGRLRPLGPAIAHRDRGRDADRRGEDRHGDPEAQRGRNAVLEVVTDRPGDFSVYTLRIDGVPALDRYFAAIRFSFMAACPIDVDCRHVVPCEPRLLDGAAPRLHGQGLRQLPADAARPAAAAEPGLGRAQPVRSRHRAARAARVRGRPPLVFPGRGRQRGLSRDGPAADLGAPARPAHRLPDARRAERVGVRPLGVNAACTVAQGTKVVTRIVAPLVGAVVAPDREMDDAAITAEASRPIRRCRRRSSSKPRTGRRSTRRTTRSSSTPGATTTAACPAGITEAYLFAAPNGVNVVRPAIAAGDALLFEEIRDPLRARGRWPTRRIARSSSSTDVAEHRDPLFQPTLLAGVLRPRRRRPPLPLLRVRWGRADALRFPLCLSARPPDVGLVRNVSVARGNIVLADHGLTTSETINLGVPLDAGPGLPAGAVARSADAWNASRTASPTIRRPPGRTSSAAT